MTAQSLQAPPPLSALAEDSPVSLFLDFDGTLVDIAPTPDSIHVPDDLARRLVALRERLAGRLAVVSGRALADLQKHTGELSVARAGSHGSDCQDADGAAIGAEPKDLAKDTRDSIAEFANRHGFSLEVKTHGAALHYRSDPALEHQGLQFAQALAEERGIIVKQGKCVIEFVADEANKASAVRAFMEIAPFAGSTPVFIGDDVTDEDGMRAANEFGGFGIAVGERASDNAQYALASPAAVHHWLQL
ncbi:trehalose-phosphatase [Aurantiacibacter sp. MUD61]|uniref:trehalose-phosphatase n=1 Tax=Aurantiacibacter sp. MUD61 TaxID=3009083 RepID=UPI0022F103D9|nr:trehalose-phosphatase [Aurantiacibacter sp. MUD61]